MANHHIENSLHYLHTKYQFHERKIVKTMGNFGVVFRLENGAGEALWAKITGKASEGEMRYWKNLYHPSILPLLDLVDLRRQTGMVVFIAPYLYRDLESFLNSRIDLAHADLEILARRWAGELGGALNYLHTRNLYLLEMNLSNVRLDSMLTAVLVDFNFLGHNSVDIPGCTVHPMVLDIWSLGLLIAQVGSSGKLPQREMTVSQAGVFLRGMVALLDHVRKPSFLSQLRKRFPTSALEARDFVMRCLEVRPDVRPSVRHLLDHPFVHPPVDLSPTVMEGREKEVIQWRSDIKNFGDSPVCPDTQKNSLIKKMRKRITSVFSLEQRRNRRQ